MGDAAAAGDPALVAAGICKRYPGDAGDAGVVANDDVSLRVERATIHAVVGENGAGKTTLMSILYGMVEPDAGTITIGSTVHRLRSPADAIAAGIGMVHQKFQLFRSMTVTENVVFGHEPRAGLVIDRGAARRQVEALADDFGLGIDPRARVADLGVGELQRVEILKALYRAADVLILDEPTAVLAPQDRDRLFTVLRRLRDDGRTIVFITHKLNEVMALADRVTVMRRGRVVDNVAVADTSPGELAAAMTGAVIDVNRRVAPNPVGPEVLAVDGVDIVDVDGVGLVHDVSLRVHAGEIVGIAAVAGSGQRPLIEAIVGLRSTAGGTIRLTGAELAGLSVRARRRRGLAYIPEDRHADGTAAAADVAANLLMGSQWQRRFQRRSFLRRRAIDDHADRVIAAYDVRVSSRRQLAGQLSGGNLQKLVVGRELDHGADLLVVEQPTRGVDVRAIEEIHRRLVERRDQGGATLLVSSELSEVLALSTRVLVMFDGRIVAELDPDTTSDREVGAYMTGAA